MASTPVICWLQPLAPMTSNPKATMAPLKGFAPPLIPPEGDPLRDFILKEASRKQIQKWETETWVVWDQITRGSCITKCTICEEVFANARKNNLERHARSTKHQRNLLKFMGIASNTMAPSTEEFRVAWSSLRSGSAPTSGSDRFKKRKMFMCIAEAMFDSDRAFLKDKSCTIALHRDEKNAKIQIEFTACNEKLDIRRGMVGMAENNGGPGSVSNTTKQILEELWKRPNGTIDHQGYTTFCNCVELINIDAAADEVLAAKEDHSPSLPQLQPLLPNCKLVARDKSHGCQRMYRAISPHSTPTRHIDQRAQPQQLTLPGPIPNPAPQLRTRLNPIPNPMMTEDPQADVEG